MQISSQKLNRTIESEMREMLYQLLVDIEDTAEMKELLDDLLSETEQVALLKRLAIAVYLDSGRSYENIKNNLKVSSATIAAVAEMMGNPGIQKAINRIKADRWAEGASQTITGIVKKMLPKK